MKFTITLSESQVATFLALKDSRPNRSDQSLIEQVVERGLYDLEYRTRNNKRRYEQQKAEREELKELRKMLAAK